MSDSSDLPIVPLRRLAYSLLFDEQRAEDAVQDAWVAALRSGNAGGGARGWLAEAVRRISRSSARDALRRGAREERAARPEAVASAADSSARIEVLRRVLDAVDALEPPYRDAIVLRYFDELPPRAIAKRLGVPVNTARTHVRRGLERLRRQLDERGRGREELLAALAPLALAPPWLGVVGVLAMKKTLAACAAVVLLVALGSLRAWGGREDAAEGAGPAELVASEASEPEPALATPAAEAARAPLVNAPALVARDWTVRGQVLKGKGEAYPGARLVGRVFDGPSTDVEPTLEERFLAGPDGLFAWSIPAPVSYGTVLVAPDEESAYERAQSDVFGPGDPPPEDWTIRIAPLDGVLRGVVRGDAESPVAGARVVYAHYPVKKEVATDAEGRYEVPTSSWLGFVKLWVLAEGFGTALVEERQLVPGVQTRDVRLRRELVVRGRVLDVAGAPLEGARVSPDSPGELLFTSSGPDGAFELRGLALDASGELWLNADAPGMRAVRERVRPGPEGDVSEGDVSEGDVELRLARAVPISGRVVAPDGSPLAAVQVCAHPGSDQWTATFTDADGRFRIEPDSVGTCALWLWRRGFAQLHHDVAVPADAASVDGLEIVLPAAHFVGGVVLDESGEPLPHVLVYAEDDEWSPNAHVWREPAILNFTMHTDASGRFRFDGLPEARVRLEVHLAGLAPLRHVVEALDRDDVVLRAAPMAGLAGLVVDDASGAPIPEFAVRVDRHEQALEFSDLDDTRRRFSGPSGEWRMEGELAAGLAFQLEIVAAGYVPGRARAVATVERDPSACVTRLRRGARIVGRVVDHASGAPLADARVEWRSPHMDRNPYNTLVTRTDASGAFALEGVPSGFATIQVRAVVGGVVDGPFRVADGETVERWVEVGGVARITGRLLDASGAALAGERVRAFGDEVISEQSDWSAITAPDGSFELAELPPGLFTLSWMRSQGGLDVYDMQTVVPLRPGQDLAVDLRPRGATTLRGELVGETTPPPALVRVLIGPAPGQRPWPWSDGLRMTFAVDGRFEVRDLEPGTWRVAANHGDPSDPASPALFGSTTVEVPASGEVETRIVLKPR